MTDTPNLGLPLLAAAQAQKHVTVNEALVRLDALAQLTLASVSEATPPAGAQDGAVYGVPAGATGAWAGAAGRLALHDNGGWIFADPQPGWRAWIADADRPALFDGAAWRLAAVAVTPNGAATSQHIEEVDVAVPAGGAFTVSVAQAAPTMVFGVTGRVLADITGTATAWRLGVAGSDDRYGSGLGLTAGAYLQGLTGTPVTYWGGLDLVVTPEGGDFAGGSLRLAIHGLRLHPPG